MMVNCPLAGEKPLPYDSGGTQGAPDPTWPWHREIYFPELAVPAQIWVLSCVPLESCLAFLDPGVWPEGERRGL